MDNLIGATFDRTNYNKVGAKGREGGTRRTSGKNYFSPLLRLVFYHIKEGELLLINGDSVIINKPLCKKLMRAQEANFFYVDVCAGS